MNNVEKFKKIATELGDLYEKKNAAYNNSFGDTYEKLGIISAVTRISDKYNRLCNLATNPDIDNLGESLEDTLRDMASYCIMTVLELENAKPIGLDMQGNIVLTKDVVMREYITDRKIRKGDKFECIQDVVRNDGEIVYRKGGVYICEENGCITNLQGNKAHIWYCGDDYWKRFFKRIN